MSGASPPSGRTLRVAVVGAGPAGFYTTDFLLRQRVLPEVSFEVDLFDRLPSPHGLVRSGVAPDHQSIKKVTKAFDRISSDARVRYFGNVCVGTTVKHAELLQHYDQVVYTTGAPTDRQLGIPGEDLAGSHAATSFVGWYNGHPDFADWTFDLTARRAVVVGLGNVAMDVARILIQDPRALGTTDIASYALEALLQSQLREVLLLGRRGPAEAAFSPREIRDIDELPGVLLTLDEPEQVLALDAAAYAGDAQKNVEFLQEVARRPPGQAERKVRLRFLCSPVELLGSAGRLASIKVEANRLLERQPGRLSAEGTGQFEVIDTNLVFRSIGYRGTALPDLPFDDDGGVICNDRGRVTKTRGGEVVARVYTAGWIKRGPVGLIGTNKTDAKETVDCMLEDARTLEPGPLGDRNAITDLLQKRDVPYVTLEDWRIIDELEIDAGKQLGKIREKFYRSQAMLAALRANRR